MFRLVLRGRGDVLPHGLDALLAVVFGCVAASIWWRVVPIIGDGANDGMRRWDSVVPSSREDTVELDRVHAERARNGSHGWRISGATISMQDESLGDAVRALIFSEFRLLPDLVNVFLVIPIIFWIAGVPSKVLFGSPGVPCVRVGFAVLLLRLFLGFCKLFLANYRRLQSAMVAAMVALRNSSTGAYGSSPPYSPSLSEPHLGGGSPDSGATPGDATAMFVLWPAHMAQLAWAADLFVLGVVFCGVAAPAGLQLISRVLLGSTTEPIGGEMSSVSSRGCSSESGRLARQDGRSDVEGPDLSANLRKRTGSFLLRKPWCFFRPWNAANRLKGFDKTPAFSRELENVRRDGKILVESSGSRRHDIADARSIPCRNSQSQEHHDCGARPPAQIAYSRGCTPSGCVRRNETPWSREGFLVVWQLFTSCVTAFVVRSVLVHHAHFLSVLFSVVFNIFLVYCDFWIRLDPRYIVVVARRYAGVGRGRQFGVGRGRGAVRGLCRRRFSPDHFARRVLSQGSSSRKSEGFIGTSEGPVGEGELREKVREHSRKSSYFESVFCCSSRRTRQKRLFLQDVTTLIRTWVQESVWRVKSRRENYGQCGLQCVAPQGTSSLAEDADAGTISRGGLPRQEAGVEGVEGAGPTDNSRVPGPGTEATPRVPGAAVATCLVAESSGDAAETPPSLGLDVTTREPTNFSGPGVRRVSSGLAQHVPGRARLSLGNSGDQKPRDSFCAFNYSQYCLKDSADNGGAAQHPAAFGPRDSGARDSVAIPDPRDSLSSTTQTAR